MPLIHIGTEAMVFGKTTDLNKSSSTEGDIIFINDSNISTLYQYNGLVWQNNKWSSDTYFRFRTIYTRGYLMGGYKDSTPWKNVNRTAHATDITTNLGDILDRSGGYVDGGWSDYYAYSYGMNNGINTGVTGVYVSSISMSTETGRTHDTNWDMKTSRYEPGVMLNSDLTLAYITGGGTAATDKHNYITEIMMAAGSVSANPVVSYTVTAAFFGQYRGWVAGNLLNASLEFSTETWRSGELTFGTDGHSKGLSTKLGHAYGKNGTNTATTQIYKYDDSNGSTLRTNLYTPDASGEENFEVGQDKGYCLGQYNGVQNNNSYRVNYLTDMITNMGADTQPKGHDGCSSGACASASSYILGGL